MCGHQVLTCFLCVACNDHQGTDNLLCLRQIGACLTVQDPLQVFNFSQLSKGLLELVSSKEYQGNVSFDLASSDVFKPVRLCVNLECFIEIGECFIDLAGLLLPCAELGCDSS